MNFTSKILNIQQISNSLYTIIDLDQFMYKEQIYITVIITATQ